MNSAFEKLAHEIDTSIKHFTKESEKHKDTYREYVKLLIGLSATATILAGAAPYAEKIAPGSGEFLPFLVLVATALTTAITAWTETRRHRELWQHEVEIRYALTDLKRGLEFHEKLKPLTDEQLEKIFDRYLAILGDSSTRWSDITRKTDTTGK